MARAATMGATGAVGATGAWGLAGCASRSTAARPPAPPPPEILPLARVAVLPVLDAWQPDNGNGFGARGTPWVTTAQPGMFGVEMAVNLVALGISAYQQSKRNALAATMDKLAFDPSRHFDERLTAALQDAGLGVRRIADASVGYPVRAGEFHRLPEPVDAVLDVRVTEAGYFSSMRAGGYSPVLQVAATLRAPAKDAEELESFGYYADYRSGGADRRWFTTPRTMTMSDLPTLEARLDEVRAGLGQVCDRVLAQLVLDVSRRCTGLARVD